MPHLFGLLLPLRKQIPKPAIYLAKVVPVLLILIPLAALDEIFRLQPVVHRCPPFHEVLEHGDQEIGSAEVDLDAKALQSRYSHI